MTNLELLARVDEGLVEFMPLQNAAVLKMPGEVIDIVTFPIEELVNADLVELSPAAPIHARRIPMQPTVAGREFLGQARRIGAVA